MPFDFHMLGVRNLQENVELFLHPCANTRKGRITGETNQGGAGNHKRAETKHFEI